LWGDMQEGVLCILTVDVVKGVFGKGGGDLCFAVSEVYCTSFWMPGPKVGEILVYVGLE
jgi:hypothetical protein